KARAVVSLFDPHADNGRKLPRAVALVRGREGAFKGCSIGRFPVREQFIQQVRPACEMPVKASARNGEQFRKAGNPYCIDTPGKQRCSSCLKPICAAQSSPTLVYRPRGWLSAARLTWCCHWDLQEGGEGI